MKTKTVYKLFRMRKDGTLAPLFINKGLVIPLNKWLMAEDVPTKGYAHRPGWHAGEMPSAPHLTEKGRVWCECEVPAEFQYYPSNRHKGMSEVPVNGWYYFKRPRHQGGWWIIAGALKVNRVMTQEEVTRMSLK